jgi:hypothetical protein
VKPSTVWMVHADTGPQGTRGDLILDGDRLIFRPDIGAAKLDTLGETVFGLHEVVKVSRPRHSPVIELKCSTEGIPDVVFFYFVKPPDIYSSGAINPRAHAAIYLTNAGAVYDEEVADWVKTLRALTS